MDSLAVGGLLDLPFCLLFGIKFAIQFSELQFILESYSYVLKRRYSATLVSPEVRDDKPGDPGPPCSQIHGGPFFAKSASC